MKKKNESKRKLMYAGIIVGAVVLFILFSGKPYTIVNMGTYAPEQVINDVATATASGVVVDTNHTDGNLTRLYASWTLYKDGVEIEGNTNSPIELSESTYSHSINKAFNETGNYVHGVVMVKSINTFVSGSWLGWTSTVVAEEKHSFTVGIPEPDTSPLSSVLDAFVNWLKSVLAFFGL